MARISQETADGKFSRRYWRWKIWDDERRSSAEDGNCEVWPEVTPDWNNDCTTVINGITSRPREQPSGEYKDEDLTVYHQSSGANSPNGCTLFYVWRPDDVVKIVGVGYHVGAQTDEIDWKKAAWCSTKKLTLDNRGGSAPVRSVFRDRGFAGAELRSYKHRWEGFADVV